MVILEEEKEERDHNVPRQDTFKHNEGWHEQQDINGQQALKYLKNQTQRYGRSASPKPVISAREQNENIILRNIARNQEN